MARVRSVSPGAGYETNTLLSGTAWQGAVTFGFARDIGADVDGATVGACPASAALKSAVRDAFMQVEAFTKLALREVPGGTDADVRIVAADGLALAGGVNVPLGAYAFMPGADPIAGDIFFGRAVTDDLFAGSYGSRAVLHEVGHALGLKHPHEAGPYGALPAHLDGAEGSVMSARSAPGMDVAEGLGIEPDGYAQSYMPADIAALQHLYGANYEDARNSRYVFDPDERVMLETIWDGGGEDTYDFSKYRGDVAIDLAPGGHSTTGQEPQLNRVQEISRGDAPIHAEGAIHNAYLFKGNERSLIENAFGGAGDDTIEGNAAANRLEGRDGDDRIFGGDRGDFLFGGRGEDLLAGGSGGDALDGGVGADCLRGNGGGDTLRGGQGDDRAEGGGGDDRLFLSYGADRAFGGAGDDRLDGQPGNDYLNGGAGGDYLFGGFGGDILIGGAGEDTLAGGSCGRQADELTGGNGADVFVVSDDAVVTDFSVREGDVLDVADPLEAFRNIARSAGDAVIDLGGEHVVLLGVAPASLALDDFI